MYCPQCGREMDLISGDSWSKNWSCIAACGMKLQQTFPDRMGGNYFQYDLRVFDLGYEFPSQPEKIAEPDFSIFINNKE